MLQSSLVRAVVWVKSRQKKEAFMRARRVISRNHVLPGIGKKEEKEDIIIEFPSRKSHTPFQRQNIGKVRRLQRRMRKNNIKGSKSKLIMQTGVTSSWANSEGKSSKNPKEMNLTLTIWRVLNNSLVACWVYSPESKPFLALVPWLVCSCSLICSVFRYA